MKYCAEKRENITLSIQKKGKIIGKFAWGERAICWCSKAHLSREGRNSSEGSFCGKGTYHGQKGGEKDHSGGTAYSLAKKGAKIKNLRPAPKKNAEFSKAEM